MGGKDENIVASSEKCEVPIFVAPLAGSRVRGRGAPCYADGWQTSTAQSQSNTMADGERHFGGLEPPTTHHNEREHKVKAAE